MKVLIVGGGGREHAIAVSVAKSRKVEKIYCAPGNAGIAQIAECVPIGVMEFDALAAFAREKEIGLVIVGMDDPLVGGLTDVLEAAGLRGIGMTADCVEAAGRRSAGNICMEENMIAGGSGQENPSLKRYDHIIIITAMEQTGNIEEATEILRKARLLLKEHGRLFLGMNNRLGIRYFCGDKDPYTGRSFDGVEGYVRAEASAFDRRKGRRSCSPMILCRGSSWTSGFFRSIIVRIRYFWRKNCCTARCLKTGCFIPWPTHSL